MCNAENDSKREISRAIFRETPELHTTWYVPVDDLTEIEVRFMNDGESSPAGYFASS